MDNRLCVQEESVLSLAYPKELSHAFRERLFPGEWGVPIIPEDISDYEVARRYTANDVPQEQYLNEKQLYEVLWPGKTTRLRPRLTFFSWKCRVRKEHSASILFRLRTLLRPSVAARRISGIDSRELPHYQAT